MERIWLKQYPPGVPADIEPTQYASLVDLLEESFTKFADRKAFICMDKSISYRDLDQMSVALAAYLQGRGLQRGAEGGQVGAVSRNTPSPVHFARVFAPVSHDHLMSASNRCLCCCVADEGSPPDERHLHGIYLERVLR